MQYRIAQPLIRPAPPPTLPARTSGINAWAVADALRCRPSGLFVDIDGTLAEIAPTPAGAFVPVGTREALRAIQPHLDLLCVLTGRPADEAWRMVGIDGALYVGNHGAEHWFRGELLRPAGIDRYRPRLARARDMTRLSLADVRGVVFEDKGMAFAVHYRQAPDAAAHVLTVARSAAARCGLDVVERNLHIEVRIPSSEDKGSALLRIAKRHGLGGVVVIGDDAVDLPAFEAARQHAAGSSGRSVVVAVGDRVAQEADADIVLANPAETRALLISAATVLRP